MKHILTLLLALVLLPLGSLAQDRDYIMVFKTDGTVDTLSLALVRDIHHSCYDADSVSRDSICTLRMATVNGRDIVYDIDDVDSVFTPKSPRTIKFTGGVKEPTRRIPHRISVSGDFDNPTAQDFDYNWQNGDIIYLSDGHYAQLSEGSGKRDGTFKIRTDTLRHDSYNVFYYGDGNITGHSNPDSTITIASQQQQTKGDYSNGISKYGNAAMGTAHRNDVDGNYSFNIDYKTAILCLMPRIDTMQTIRLKNIGIKATGGQAIAGKFKMTADGVELVSDASDTISLNTYSDWGTTPSNYFRLPNNKLTAQDTVGSYVVIAPQSEPTQLRVWYTVYDSVFEKTYLAKRNFTISKIEPQKVYPMTSKIKAYLLKAVATDSTSQDKNFNDSLPATLYGRINFKPDVAGFIWGDNAGIDLEHNGGKGDAVVGDDYHFSLSPEGLRHLDDRIYYYRAYANDGQHDYLSNVGHFGLDLKKLDLGLPSGLKWANINLGQTFPTDSMSNRYNWGTMYIERSAEKTHDTSAPSTLKHDIEGDPHYDAATITWRGCWRLPTTDDVQELLDNLTLATYDPTTRNVANHIGGLYEFYNKNQDAATRDTLMFKAYAWNDNQDQLAWTGTYQDEKDNGPAGWSFQVPNANSVKPTFQPKWSSSSHDLTPIRPVWESNCQLSSGTGTEKTDFFIRMDSAVIENDSLRFSGTMRGITRSMSGQQVGQGFLLSTSPDATFSTGVSFMPWRQAPDNGAYDMAYGNDGSLSKLSLFQKYYVHAFVSYNKADSTLSPTYSVLSTTPVVGSTSTTWRPFLNTDDNNTNIRGQYQTSATLKANASRILPGFNEKLKLGFVLGTAADVTRSTTGVTDVESSHEGNGDFTVDVTNTLKPNTQYFYRAYIAPADGSGDPVYSDPCMIGLRAVDLGLTSGIKWANINVGTASPSERGDAYYYGSTTGTSNGSDDYFIAGNPDRDVATNRWMGCWRLPTYKDVYELKTAINNNSITTENVVMNGAYVKFLKSATDSIGFYYGDKPSTYNYWIGNRSSGGKYPYFYIDSDSLKFNNNNNSSNTSNIYVRPVYESNLRSKGGVDFYSSPDSMVVNGSTTYLYGTMRGQTYTVKPTEGFIVGKTNSDDKLRLKGDVDTVLTFTKAAKDVTNGQYKYELSTAESSKLGLGGTYYLRTFIINGGDTLYSPIDSTRSYSVKAANLTVTADSTSWRLGVKRPVLYATLAGLPLGVSGVTVGFEYGKAKHNFDGEFTNELSATLSDDNTKITSAAFGEDVKPGTVYMYRAWYDTGDGVRHYSNVAIFGLRPVKLDNSGLLWSNIDMGASSPAGHLNVDTYKWGALKPGKSGSACSLTTEIAGNPDYDVATATWQGCWRMPTSEDITALKSNITVSSDYASLFNDNTGYAYISKLTDDPDTIYIGKVSSNNYADNRWTGSYSDYRPYFWDVDQCSTGTTDKTTTYSVRPVYDSNVTIDGRGFYASATAEPTYSNKSITVTLTARGLGKDIMDDTRDSITSLTTGFIIGTSKDCKIGDADNYNVTTSSVLTSWQTTENGKKASQVIGADDFYHILFPPAGVARYFLRPYVQYGGTDETHTGYGDAVPLVASFNIPETNSLELTLPDTVHSGYRFNVYDNNGPASGYEKNKNGYMVITAPKGAKLQIIGKAVTDGTSNSPLMIYDGGITAINGTSASGDITKLGTYGGTGDASVVNITSTSNVVSLHFKTGGFTPEDGIDLQITVVKDGTFDVTMTQATGGTLTASNLSDVNAGDTVTLTATPDKGYLLKEVKVTSTNGDVLLTFYDEDPLTFGSTSKDYDMAAAKAKAQRVSDVSDTVRVRDGNWWHDTSWFLMPYGDVTVTPVWTKGSDGNFYVEMPANDTIHIKREFTKRLLDAGVSSFGFGAPGASTGKFTKLAKGFLVVEAPDVHLLRATGNKGVLSGDHFYLYDGNKVVDKVDKNKIKEITQNSFDETTRTDTLIAYFNSDNDAGSYGVKGTISFFEDTIVSITLPSDTTTQNVKAVDTQEYKTYGSSHTIIYEVYSDGGRYAKLSNDAAGTVNLTLPEGLKGHITGTNRGDSGDKLTITDGVYGDSSSTTLVDHLKGDEKSNVDVTSTTNVIGVNFTTDGNVGTRCDLLITPVK